MSNSTSLIEVLCIHAWYYHLLSCHFAYKFTFASLIQSMYKVKIRRSPHGASHKALQQYVGIALQYNNIMDTKLTY